jgi:predicted alpha/beta hydrolase family esterase
MQGVTFVFLAGIGNSGDGHWQRAWHERLPGSVWVEHDDWERPVKGDWVSDFQAALWKIRGPVVVIAHSLGCLVLAEWARTRDDPSIAGAFLVAVPDPDSSAFPAVAAGFGDLTKAQLSFPSLVLASRNDDYAGIGYARDVAHTWGAEFADMGDTGHINAASGLGDWDEGWRLLEAFVERLKVSDSSGAP